MQPSSSQRTVARLPNAFGHAAVCNNREKNEDADLTGTARLLKIIPNKAALSYLQQKRERLGFFKRKILKISSISLILKKAGEHIMSPLQSNPPEKKVKRQNVSDECLRH